MKKKYAVYLLGLVIFAGNFNASSQICDPTVPLFNVDLTGSPNGSWISPSVIRNGLCCSASGSDVCVEFIITLDPAANGIRFDIISGAVPGGSLFYQVNCGTPAPLGSPICLSGVGPHYITFCKPGNNDNVYEIRSIPEPSAGGTQWVSEACTGTLMTQGLDESTITWTSLPFNPVHNTYLSCTSGCDTVYVTPTGTIPAFVDYQVCGSVTGYCDTIPFCDTIRIYFVNTLAVNIVPPNPTICFGGPPTTVAAQPSGGIAPFSYLWSNGATTQSILAGAGTWSVIITDGMNCGTAYDTVVINALPSAIAANAGIDQLLCNGAVVAVSLNGTLAVATGGIWMGGSGTFNPDNTTLNAIYTPSSAEISAGVAQLILITTGNSGCPADSDYIQITIAPQPSPIISGATTLCQYESQYYIASNVTPVTYLWNVSGGSVTSNNGDSIIVYWPSPTSGSVTVTASNTAGCDTVITIPVTINPQPTPVITGAFSACTPVNNVYHVTNPMGDNLSWSITGGIISGSSNTDSVLVQWTNAGTGTVAVTLTSSAGCDSAISISVALSSTPVTAISGMTSICGSILATYISSPSNAVSFNWSVTGGSIMNNNGSSIDVLWTTPGSGNVTLTVANSSGCDTTIIYPVNVYPQPVPVITGAASACTPVNNVYHVNNPMNDNVIWNVTGGIVSGSTTVDSIVVQWIASGTGTVTVTLSNNNGCDSTVSIFVSLSSTPITSISGMQNICGTIQTSYTAAPSNAISFSWSVTGGAIVNNMGSSIDVQWTTVGTGNVTLTAINSEGCDTTISYPVNIHPQPAPVISGPLSLCLPVSAVYHVSSPGLNNFVWTVIGGSVIGSAFADSVQVQWNNINGTGTVTVLVANSFGCDSSVTIVVNLSVTPSPFISGAQSFCGLQSGQYVVSPSNATSWNWNVSGGVVASYNGDTVVVQWTSTGSGTITMTATNSVGCDTTLYYQATVYPVPSPVVTGPDLVCTPSQSTYSISVNTGDIYSWTVNGGSVSGTSTADNVLINWNTTGTGMVTLTVTNSFGCDTTVNKFVTLNPYPSPAITGNGTNCLMDTATYSVAHVAGHSYNWNVAGGTIISFTVAHTIDVYWYNPGAGSVSLVQTSAEGCASLDNKNVFINPLPVPAISGPPEVCQNEVQNYSAAPHAGSTYSWSVLGGNFQGSSMQVTTSIQWPMQGQGTLLLFETDLNGCSANVTTQILINPLPDASISGSLFGCVDPYGSTYMANPVNTMLYQWSPAGGSVTSGNGSSQVQIRWFTTGPNLVNLAVMNILTGCVNNASLPVLVSSMPQPVITGSNHNGCAPLTANFTSNPLVPDYSYHWEFGDGYSSIAATPAHQYSMPGNYTITLIASNNVGCWDTVQSQVSAFVSPISSFDLEATDNFYPVDITTFTVLNSSVGATEYQWDFGDGNMSTEFSPEHQYALPGSYQVQLVTTNNHGCRDTMRTGVEIRVPEDIYVPDAFTPNGDTHNDVFNVSYRNISELHILIFNRWGHVIFDSNDKDFAWDGFYNGSKVQAGVYVYKLEALGFHGYRYDKIGTVAVVR